MLVLSRKLLESIVIGDGIEVCVLKIEGGKVRLGVRAPEDVPVHRMEVYREMLNEDGVITPGGRNTGQGGSTNE